MKILTLCSFWWKYEVWKTSPTIRRKKRCSMQRRPIERSAERRKYFKIWWGILNLEKNISKSDYEYQTWKWIIPNSMKNHPVPTWQAEKEFCESAHLVFVCRPWKEEHILKILNPTLIFYKLMAKDGTAVFEEKKFTGCTPRSFLHILHS